MEPKRGFRKRYRTLRQRQILATLLLERITRSIAQERNSVDLRCARITDQARKIPQI